MVSNPFLRWPQPLISVFIIQHFMGLVKGKVLKTFLARGSYLIALWIPSPLDDYYYNRF